MGSQRPDIPLDKKCKVLKYFVLPEMHFKANLFFYHLTHPTTQPQNYRGGECKMGAWSLIKVKKQVDFKMHFRRFSIFRPCFFPLRVLAGWVRALDGKFH